MINTKTTKLLAALVYLGWMTYYSIKGNTPAAGLAFAAMWTVVIWALEEPRK